MKNAGSYLIRPIAVGVYGGVLQHLQPRFTQKHQMFLAGMLMLKACASVSQMISIVSKANTAKKLTLKN